MYSIISTATKCIEKIEIDQNQPRLLMGFFAKQAKESKYFKCTKNIGKNANFSKNRKLKCNSKEENIRN